MSSGNSKDLEQLAQYLLLGQEGACYTAGIKRAANSGLIKVRCLESLLADGKGLEVVATVQSSCQQYAIGSSARVSVLAACALNADPDTKKAAYSALPKVCKTAKDLLTFVSVSEQLSKARGTGTGWGRAHRTAVQNWYECLHAKDLIDACAKHPKYAGWSHRDLFRLAHIKSSSTSTGVVLRFLLKGFEAAEEQFGTPDASPEVIEILHYLKAIRALRQAKDEQEAAYLVSTHGLPFEYVPNNFRKSAEVWRSLIPVIPLRQLLLHLRRFATLGFLAPNSGLLTLVLEQLTSSERIATSQLHPVEVYIIMRKYEELGKASSGRMFKRRLTLSVINALHNMFLASMQYVPTTGKRFLVAVDVRNPMVHGRVHGCQFLTPAVAAVLLFLPLMHVETHVTVAAFGMRDLSILNLKKEMRIADVTKCMRETPMGAVNCAKPMLWAEQRKKPFDVFLVITDNQIKPVEVKPVDAICQYRHSMDLPNTKLIICALSIRKFSLTSADDSGMLDIAGFDIHVPRIICDFVSS